ncbi:DUF2339 domain-containing protein [Acetobacter orleanensis]|uniref:Uncharacterized protein n=1 Tax=Acetobacter orleanensis TaxID=104099 RepID=A0A4Y3TJU7_9PROT|nr:hypothetical protein [Acetobacter orleanensis]GAN68054.1 hypothetical protein Abol_014_105 [Acetobacter orleanensis JCM 7639]GBR27205.1 hypothetical protein AA0473_1368 [Acetobacter orleanensis NRIC 0473]GEB82023.1 hypothetical protein AOR01nite_05000 [Acetobacter orleanensis]
MTLAVILAPLLALCVVARGMGFLPVLGAVTAAAMLLDRQEPLQEFGAACVVLFSVLPVWFVSRYQDDGARERSGPAVPFLALGLMIILQLATGTPAAMGNASGHGGAAYLPAGLCVALAGLVAVTCRQAMVWQWAGLLVCVDGVMLSGVIENQIMVVGVTALAGCVVALLGGMCVHRVMLRVTVAPAQGKAGVEHPSARPGGFELGDIDPAGPEPRSLGPESVVAPRIWTEAEAAADDEEPLPRPEKTDQKTASSTVKPEPSIEQAEASEGALRRKRLLDAEAAFSGDERDEEAGLPKAEAEMDTLAPHTESSEKTSADADPRGTVHSDDDADDDADPEDTERASPSAIKEHPPEKRDVRQDVEPDTDQAEAEEPAPEPLTPEMIARDVWLRGYLTERGRDV